jgi:nucleoside-diphosphate-sugar epimerase
MNRHLFEAACKAGVKKIIFSSSIGVIARRLPLTSASQLPRTLPLDENTPPEPDNWYGLAKLCSEEMLAMFRRQYGIDYVNLRFPALVNTVPIPNYEAYKNRLCEGLSYLSIRDAADLILKVIDADVPGGRTYLPASRKNTQGLPVADLIRDRFAGVPLRKPAEEMECLVDISTLKHEIGWESQELSQPEVETRLPLSWRLRKLLLNPVPESLKLFLKRLFVARV